MKTVSILISNYNSFEAIKLCLESVRKYTKYPHSIMVYDDASTNKVDLEYLTKAHYDNWIKLLTGKTRLNHGGVLNELLDVCNTDLAMILDNDVQILETGWLEDMVKLMEDDVLIATGIEGNYKSGRPSLPDWFQSWFMMLNMDAYRDGMEVDWKACWTTHKGEEVVSPTGGKLWLKMRNDNPKGYRHILIPWQIQIKYHHFAHVSCIATSSPMDEAWLIKAREEKLGEIRQELIKLRGQDA